MDEIESAEIQPFVWSDLTLIEQVGIVGAYVLSMVLMGAFFYFFFWRMIKAQLQVPKELAAIRAALEKIADRLDKQ